MESEFFGHKKGSFTGAHSDKAGLFQAASGGSLFLDEIADLPLHMQVKLLRAIQEKSVRPVGSQTEEPVDVRLLSATHKNLAEEVAKGNLRQDLYYRINVFPIHLPSLHERTTDIPLIADALLKRLPGGKDFTLGKAAKQVLAKHHFRGNIRELRNILSRAVVLSDTPEISVDTINSCFFDQPASLVKAAKNAVTDAAEVDLKTLEQDYISELLRRYDQDKEKVAGILGISLRSLYRKISERDDA